MFRKKIYNTINIAVLAITLGFFVWQFFFSDKISFSYSPLYYLSIMITVVIVCTLKFFRLYLIIYGLHISHRNHMIQFIKTVSVNTVIPLKAGELFRIYCYGCASDSLLSGIVCITLDRFADTLALLTIIIVVSLVSGISFSVLFYLLLTFIFLVIIVYFVFPPAFSYWNQYFIEGTASPIRLRILSVLEKSNSIYAELKKIVSSRGIILYLLSLAAWFAEAVGYYYINKIFSEKVSSTDIFYYLESAIGLNSSEFQKNFVFISVILSVSVYCVLGIIKRLRHKEHL